MLDDVDSGHGGKNGSMGNLPSLAGASPLNGAPPSNADLPPKRKRRAVDRGFAVDSSPPKKPKRIRSEKKREAEAEFDAVWICSECKEAECLMKQDAEDLLICDGLCRRLFHYPCAGLQSIPSENESFVCTDCKSRKHKCSFCSSYGADDEDVFKCSKAACGLFFHESCLAMKNVEVDVVPTTSMHDTDGLTSPRDSHKPVAYRRSFVCPAHCCWTCTQLDLKELDKETPPEDSIPKGKAKKRKAGSSAFESKPDAFKTVSGSLRALPLVWLRDGLVSPC
jgi:hypothetical protein